VKRFWVCLGLLAFIGVSFTAANLSVSPASAAACFSSFTNKTTADGLGNNIVAGVYAVSSNVYAATSGGLSISADCASSSTTTTPTLAATGSSAPFLAAGLALLLAIAGGGLFVARHIATQRVF
jgi:hypothetical protein